jgi:hypothetical protein
MLSAFEVFGTPDKTQCYRQEPGPRWIHVFVVFPCYMIVLTWSKQDSPAIHRVGLAAAPCPGPGIVDDERAQKRMQQDRQQLSDSSN